VKYYLSESLIDSGKSIWKEVVFNKEKEILIEQCMKIMNEIRVSNEKLMKKFLINRKM
jgi:hypothetical protein